MAELDMDVDLAPPMKLDEHVDEDLIDYDIDTTEDHGREQFSSLSSHQDEHTSGAPERVHPVEGMEGAEPRYTEVGQAEEKVQHSKVSHPQGDMDYEHAEAVEQSHQDSEVFASTHHDKDTVLETEQAKDFHEIDGNANTGDIVVTEAEHAVDEIDYEDEDATVTQDFLQKPDDANGGVHEGRSNDDAAAAEDVASTTTAVPASLPSTEAPVGSSEVPEPASKDDEDEITWENEDDAEKHGEQESAADFEDNAAAYDHADIDPNQQAYEQHSHATDSDYDADAVVEVTVERTSPAYHQDDSQSPAEQQDSEAADFPAITVQYKGDEFPFFSQEKTEGFFSDLSVLDRSMESVLAGLRSELENEIAAQDVLVFQVDELGLEFAEVCKVSGHTDEKVSN
jgi:hypothetical protein